MREHHGLDGLVDVAVRSALAVPQGEGYECHQDVQRRRALPQFEQEVGQLLRRFVLARVAMTAVSEIAGAIP
jgi:hypothetical protein